jgi:NAD-dependent deacetylase
MEYSVPVRQLGALMAGSERMLVVTGAGVSTASGIPDYRGPRGVWRTEQPVFYQDFMADRAARQRYWNQKLAARRHFAPARPNAVHGAITRLAEAGRVELVVTQNVDGLHALAGTPDDRLVEIHGTVRHIECQTCGARSAPEGHFATFAETGEPPECPCGGYLKPATVSFGQQLRSDDLERAYAAAGRSDLVVALGSTLSVTPAADVPLAAARRGVPYAIVNRGPTDHDSLPVVTLRVDGDVGEVFPPAVAIVLAAPQVTLE